MSDRPTILVTGAGGYIGSHCIIELLEKNYNVVGIDNFSNSVKGSKSEFSLNFKNYFFTETISKITEAGIIYLEPF